MGKTVERIVNAERVEDLIAVFGSFDENIKRIEEALEVHVINRGTDLRVSGEEEAVDKAEMLRRKHEWSKGVAKFSKQRKKEIW